jgi:diaminohydroxyphosphoribosylaminopyrimidine deaminase/5-amino-6-(5-phosphoribosylamino)uracil reductase
VCGAGIARLHAAGIQVDTGVLAAPCEKLNTGFFSRHRRGLPWVRVKLAASLDGRTALANGHSQWITGEAARADVQAWRARSSAILTGAGTLKHDDARLTVRDESLALLGRQPLRVVLDRALLVSPSARLFSEPGPILIITESQNQVAIDAIRARGAEVQVFARDSGLREVLQELARRECNEVWVEAGAKLSGLFLQSALVDEFIVYLAPHLLGQDAAPLATLPIVSDLERRWRFRYQDVRTVGLDLRLTLVPVQSGES